MIDDDLARAVVRVGGGRGFIVQHGHLRLVVTAAHCLPHFPLPAATIGYDERTYQGLLGPLDGSEPTVWAELLFADPIADIAVLGTPDWQELWKQAEAYDGLTYEAPTLEIGSASKRQPAWVLQPTGQWTRCIVHHDGGPLWIEEAAEGIHSGMSGSPIVSDDGTAIGVVCASGGREGQEIHTEGGPNARLAAHLPGWLLSEISWSPES